MTNRPSADARITRLLASVPLYRTWRGQPLDAELRKRLADADLQMLMTLVVGSLHRIFSESPEPNTREIMLHHEPTTDNDT